MTLDELVATVTDDGAGGWEAPVVDNWTQGRTLYGGANAALALAAARAMLPGLPPLRSLQLAFVGPIAERVSFKPRLLRQGRSASFVAVEAWSGGALATQILLLFAHGRDSAVDKPARTAPPPAQGDVLVVPPQVRFASNFDIWFAGEGHDPCNRWVRLKTESMVEAEIELVATADLLPPPALFDFGSFVPLSTMTWQLDLLRPVTRSADRRWHLSAVKEMNSGGLSTQAMAIEDGDGVAVARGRQSVALFG